ncbi:hypothetical protein QOT17_002721 [Balamuthia mandrillaris]
MSPGSKFRLQNLCDWDHDAAPQRSQSFGPSRRIAQEPVIWVHGFWGPYSPKTYDAHWVLDHQDTLDTKWKGAYIIGDCHFSVPKDTLENVKIITPVPEPGKKQPKLYKATKNAMLCDKAGRGTT